MVTRKKLRWKKRMILWDKSSIKKEGRAVWPGEYEKEKFNLCKKAFALFTKYYKWNLWWKCEDKLKKRWFRNIFQNSETYRTKCPHGRWSGMHFDLDTVNGVKKGIIFTEPDLMKKNIVKYSRLLYNRKRKNRKSKRALCS